MSRRLNFHRHFSHFHLQTIWMIYASAPNFGTWTFSKPLSFKNLTACACNASSSQKTYWKTLLSFTVSTVQKNTAVLIKFSLICVCALQDIFLPHTLENIPTEILGNYCESTQCVDKTVWEYRKNKDFLWIQMFYDIVAWIQVIWRFFFQI